MGDAWSYLVSWDNLLSCWKLAATGKRGSEAVARFEHRLGENLLALQKALVEQRWRPGPYVSFHIHEPKRRLISAAPFADRIVHHALVRAIAPRFERGFVSDSFANRVGLGTHAAVNRLQALCRRWPYVLRLDVKQHFPSIDHDLLRQALFRRVPEPPLRDLIDRVLRSGAGIHPEPDAPDYFAGDDLLAACRAKGLPIGNLSSQFWSNVYLDALDQFVRRTLGCRGYVRYVDDMALFADTPATLLAWRDAVVGFAASRLRLRIHLHSAHPQRTADGVPWLGFVVYPEHRRVKARKVVEACRRLRRSHRAWRSGEIRAQTFDAQVQGWVAHMRHAQTWGLRQHVLAAFELGARDGCDSFAFRRAPGCRMHLSPAGDKVDIRDACG